jgi:hypothetical protein
MDMSGYAAASPLLLGGPIGWIAYAVVGTAVTVGTIVLAKKAYDATRTEESQDTTRSEPVPKTRDRAEPKVDVKPCEACKRPYSITVHAQGTDCGGKSSSTIGPPALVRIGVPFAAAEGVALSEVTWGMLSKSQKKIRTDAKLKMQAWMLNRPPGGYLGQKTFPASDPSGGKRFDTDSYGPSPNYVT